MAEKTHEIRQDAKKTGRKVNQPSRIAPQFDMIISGILVGLRFYLLCKSHPTTILDLENMRGTPRLKFAGVIVHAVCRVGPSRG